MSNSFKFVTAGLDIRVWPSPGNFSADVMEWPQDEALYEQAQSDIGLRENELQLLHPSTEIEAVRLIELVRGSSNATLVALQLTEIALAAYPQHTHPYVPQKKRWDVLGYDVCDINGFFSFLNMGVYSKEALPLFKEEELLRAFAMSELANIRVAAHRPFVVVRLMRLGGQ